MLNMDIYEMECYNKPDVGNIYELLPQIDMCKDDVK